MAKDDDEKMEGERAEKLIEEHKVWKQNTPSLYDLIITHALEWLPRREEPPGKDYVMLKVILGTHAKDNEPKYLHLAQVQLTVDEVENEGLESEEDSGVAGGFGV